MDVRLLISIGNAVIEGMPLRYRGLGEKPSFIEPLVQRHIKGLDLGIVGGGIGKELIAHQIFFLSSVIPAKKKLRQTEKKQEHPNQPFLFTFRHRHFPFLPGPFLPAASSRLRIPCSASIPRRKKTGTKFTRYRERVSQIKRKRKIPKTESCIA